MDPEKLHSEAIPAIRKRLDEFEASDQQIADLAITQWESASLYLRDLGRAVRRSLRL